MLDAGYQPGARQLTALVAEVDIEELKGHIDINLHAVVALYQATREMLKESKRKGGPMFVAIGSTAGCLGWVLLFLVP